jgi:hypothetical protein
MEHGTGFDILLVDEENGALFRNSSLEDGIPNGYEWWFASPNMT